MRFRHLPCCVPGSYRYAVRRQSAKARLRSGTRPRAALPPPGEPTAGVDIGAADFIHRRLRALKAAGTVILLVSSDLDEIRALADRILVMEAGRIAGILGHDAGESELGLPVAAHATAA